MKHTKIDFPEVINKRVLGFFALTLKSRNRKTGDIPVSTSHSGTCPNSCPLKKNGCYGDGGHIRIFWDKVTKGKAGTTWKEFLEKVSQLKEGQLWRLNQVGDLPPASEGSNYVSDEALQDLTRANSGKRGFGFTHYNINYVVNYLRIREANKNGLTINASANNLEHADYLADYSYQKKKLKFPEIPIATVLPQELERKDGESLSDYKARIPKKTPKGYKLTICPATYMDTNCKACQLCSVYKRETIVGFPAHGISAKKADAIARGV